MPNKLTNIHKQIKPKKKGEALTLRKIRHQPKLLNVEELAVIFTSSAVLPNINFKPFFSTTPEDKWRISAIFCGWMESICTRRCFMPSQMLFLGHLWMNTCSSFKCAPPLMTFLFVLPLTSRIWAFISHNCLSTSKLIIEILSLITVLSIPYIPWHLNSLFNIVLLSNHTINST